MSCVAELAVPAASVSKMASAICVNLFTIVIFYLDLFSICHNPTALYHFDDRIRGRLHLLLGLDEKQHGSAQTSGVGGFPGPGSHDGGLCEGGGGTGPQSVWAEAGFHFGIDRWAGRDTDPGGREPGTRCGF